MSAVGLPAAWQRDDEEVEAEAQEMAQEQAMNAAMQQVGAGGAAAEQAGKGIQAMAAVDEEAA